MNDLTITNWPTGNSIKIIDLAITNPVSDSIQYSATPISLDPERLLKKREIQKIQKYRRLVESSKGGTFEPLVIGTSGNVTKTTSKLIRTICSKQDDNDSTVHHRYNYEFWMARISFSLQKTIANEIIIRSGRVNGKQYTTHYANNMFPDSVDIHLQMNG